MILYHGSIVKVETPEIFYTEIGRDFGAAFYTTDIKEQTERWAVRKAKIANRRIVGYIQEKYQMSENEALRVFYHSATAEALSDDETGLYGQSPLYLFGLFMDEYEGNRSD